MEIIRKRNIFITRLLVVIIISYLTIFGPLKGIRIIWSYLFIAFYLSTNLLLPYIPDRFFTTRKIFYALVFFDSGMVSLGIYLSGQAGTDFYLVYFVILALAAISIELKYLMINTIIFVFLYGWILYQNGSFKGDMAATYALRLPFIVIIAIFFGYIVEEIQEAVIARKEAEKANQTKSDFLASMSHELRTPLNAVIGFSEVLRDRYFGELNEKQADYVNDILESGKHLLSLIKDILDLSKIEAGKVELELSKVNIKELLKNSLIMIKEKCVQHGIDLGINIAQDLEDLEITADRRKLKQVMFNLLSNAAKFTPHGGTVTLETKLISDFRFQISELEKEKIISDQSAICNLQSAIEISVADSGIGISPKDQEKIFEEFHQVRSSLTDKTPGTGLGLSLVKRLVEMHGGRVWVESKVGKGTTFYFSLPRS